MAAMSTCDFAQAPDAAMPPRLLRVGLVVHGFPVVSETFVARLGADLLEAGHDVRILATGPAEADGPVHDFVNTTGLDRRVSHASGHAPLSRAALWRIARRSPAHAIGALGLGALDRLAPRRLAEARMWAAEAPLDVVHAQFGWAGLAAARQRLWGTLRTRALVVHFRGHDITTFVAEHGQRVYARLFREADRFIANSAHFRDRAIRLGCPPEKIRVIGSPIDTDFFAPPARARDRGHGPLRLVAVGRLVEKKGFADAIAAVELLRKAGHAATLRIVGDGPLRAQHERDADDRGLGDAVRFTGAATRVEVRDALHAAHILLAPSVRSASGDEDAAVNTLKEALATEMPVVATRHGGIPELVMPGENGLLVPERDPRALAEAIANLARHPESWPKLGKAGRKKVLQEYGRGVILGQTIETYFDALSDQEPGH
jgi:colanic acid/amylovoran biosynthesis glycosyltransferase